MLIPSKQIILTTLVAIGLFRSEPAEASNRRETFKPIACVAALTGLSGSSSSHTNRGREQLEIHSPDKAHTLWTENDSTSRYRYSINYNIIRKENSTSFQRRAIVHLTKETYDIGFMFSKDSRLFAHTQRNPKTEELELVRIDLNSGETLPLVTFPEGYKIIGVKNETTLILEEQNTALPKEQAGLKLEALIHTQARRGFFNRPSVKISLELESLE